MDLSLQWLPPQTAVSGSGADYLLEHAEYEFYNHPLELELYKPSRSGEWVRRRSDHNHYEYVFTTPPRSTMCARHLPAIDGRDTIDAYDFASYLGKADPPPEGDLACIEQALNGVRHGLMNDFKCLPAVQLRATATLQGMIDGEAYFSNDDEYDEYDDVATRALAYLSNTGAYRGRGPQWAQKLADEENAARMAELEAQLAAARLTRESRGAGSGPRAT